MGEIILIRKDLDVLISQEKVRSLAHSYGFSDKAEEDLAIIAGELASNLVKHTSAGGTLGIEYYPEEGSIEIIAEDSDRGFRIDAIRDGFSTANSLGIGLGAVNRLSDEMYFGRYERFQVRAKKYREASTFRLDVSALSYPTMNMVGTNGDGFTVVRRHNYALVAVMDALGHGIAAHEAVTAAKDIIEREHYLDLNDLILRIHEILKSNGMKGIAGSFIKYQSAGWGELSAVGNVYTKFYYPGQRNSVRLIESEGIIGERIRKLNCQRFDIADHMLTVMFSDGISSQLEVREYQRDLPLVELSHILMNSYSKGHDDRTILLGRLHFNKSETITSQSRSGA